MSYIKATTKDGDNAELTLSVSAIKMKGSKFYKTRSPTWWSKSVVGWLEVIWLGALNKKLNPCANC